MNVEWICLCVVIVVVGNGYKSVACMDTCVPIVDEGTLIRTVSSQDFGYFMINLIMNNIGVIIPVK